MARGALIHGQNFYATLDGKPMRVGFFVTLAVEYSRDNVAEEIGNQLRDRVSREKYFLRSASSYFQIDDLWEVAELSQLRSKGGFSLYPMSFAESAKASARYYVFKALVAMGAINSVHEPVRLKVD
jgi:hypothetical protein